MKFDKQKLKIIFKISLIILISGIFAVLIIPFVTYEVFDSKENNISFESKDNKKDSLSIQDSIYSFIFNLRLENPKIVMAQCIEESGNFKSKLFKEGYNCLGMKCPSKRPTLAKGILYGHGKFDSWKECLIDYSIWQQIYARGLKEEEYFAYLDRVYAEKKGYSNRLKEIIKKYNL